MSAAVLPASSRASCLGSPLLFGPHECAEGLGVVGCGVVDGLEAWQAELARELAVARSGERLAGVERVIRGADRLAYLFGRVRLLVPLWRTSPAYQVLRVSHNNYETAHHRWRERYAVAGDTKADRSKRRGIGVQQLRGSASLVIEWLTICHRQGWLGGPVLNERDESVVSREEAESYCTRILNSRHALGLTGVPEEAMLDHQAEVASAYVGGGFGHMGAGSAYGPYVEFDEVLDGIEWVPQDTPPDGDDGG